MLARVLVQRYPADVLTDEVVEKVRTDVLATIRRQEGNRAVLLLLDRATGKAMSVSLWDGEEALGNSAQAAGQIKGEVSSLTGNTPMAEYEGYEVLALDLDDAVLSDGANR